MAVIAVGQLSITLPSSAKQSIFIQDLDLHLDPGQTVDLGARYTQKQILDSTELKLRLDETTITSSASGTTPSLEQAQV